MLDNVKAAPPRTRRTARAGSGARRGGGRTPRTFLTEVRNEMKRVTWPSSKEVYATTFVVILTSIFFGVYLFSVDYLSRHARALGLPAFGAAHMTDVSTKQWYIVHTYSGFEKKVAESLAAARAGLRSAGRDWRNPDSDRRRGRDARRQEGGDLEAVLPRLHPGRDEHVRPRDGTW